MSPLSFATPSVFRAQCSALWDVQPQAEQHRADRKVGSSSRPGDE